MIWCYTIKFSIDICGQKFFHIFRRPDKFITIWIHFIVIVTVSVKIRWCLRCSVATYFLPGIFCIIADLLFLCNFIRIDVTEEEQVGYDAEDAWQEVSRYGTSETPSDFYGDRDNYDEMYPNSDELVGSTEDVEEFLSADIDGKFDGVTPNHNKYEEEL